VKGLVVIGNGGADLGVRGYVSAYDAATGELVWRFYTVPGDPAKPFESKALEHGAKTWTGEWWKVGGGGTVWDSMAYDPELDLLYVGTGNGSPLDAASAQPGRRRQPLPLLDPRPAPRHGRARLALPDDARRILGLHRDPAHPARRSRDRGRPRKVLLQAPKNGFFYVLDRETGEFISAKSFVPVTWATARRSRDRRPGRRTNAPVRTRPS
jgi:quinohemoprotein ethanol dehydrogenase